MEIMGAILEAVLMVLAVLTALAFCWRCVYGFESAETRASLREIAQAMQKLAASKAAE